MTNAIVLLALVAFFSGVFYWAFKNLPAEHWQIMAAVPSRRRHDGTWHGINLTYYGFFNASACVFACATIFVLLASINVPPVATFFVTCLLLLVCFPAARLVARLVERKSSTFTVGGASFVGIVLLPWIIEGFNKFAAQFGLSIPVVQTMAAVAIAYAFGEALGRLACISFGCCYGKVLWHIPLPLQALRRFCFVFRGETKKVSYEADLIGMPLFPIQGVTAIVFALAGLGGTFFFLKSNFTVAVILPVTITQLWRALSETLRADYRGAGRFSAYQVMALIAFVYSLVVIALIDRSSSVAPNVAVGLWAVLNTPGVIFLQILWLAIFLYTGRSAVTAATLSFHVVREKI